MQLHPTQSGITLDRFIHVCARVFGLRNVGAKCGDFYYSRYLFETMHVSFIRFRLHATNKVAGTTRLNLNKGNLHSFLFVHCLFFFMMARVLFKSTFCTRVRVFVLFNFIY